MKNLAYILSIACFCVVIGGTLPAAAGNEQVADGHPGSGISNYLDEIPMVRVEGGCFDLDSGGDDSARKQLQGVCVDDYKIGKFEVTQGLWQAVMGDNPSHFQMGPDYPVEMVSWQDIHTFLAKLNQITGKNYRLPTDAEWVFACFSRGRDEKFCGSDNAKEVAWYKSEGGKKTKRVGTKQANGLGIYDMSGNVEEFVQGLPANGGGYLVRGGEWHCGEDVLQIVKRQIRPKKEEIIYKPISNRKGFRLVLPD